MPPHVHFAALAASAAKRRREWLCRGSGSQSSTLRNSGTVRKRKCEGPDKKQPGKKQPSAASADAAPKGHRRGLDAAKAKWNRFKSIWVKKFLDNRRVVVAFSRSECILLLGHRQLTTITGPACQ